MQEDCLDAGQVLPILYYHQPFSMVPDKRPLTDCCVSLSNYFGKEKEYLIQLLVELGATYQDVFARVAKEEKGNKSLDLCVGSHCFKVCEFLSEE